MSKKDAAVEALKFNKGMNNVFISEDKKVFVSKNAAVNYSVTNKLKAEEVEEFDRSVLEDSKDEDSDESLTYEELIKSAVDLGYDGKSRPKKQVLIDFIESKKED